MTVERKPYPASPSPEQRVATLIEAIPYLNEFKNSVVVVKLGGSALVEKSLFKSFADDIALLHLIGIKVVVVHGGGPQINAALQKAGKESRFVDGMRVTDEETMAIVKRVLVEEVNHNIVAAINASAPISVGIAGDEGNLLQAELLAPAFGLVGQVTKVDPRRIEQAHEANLVPVVSCLVVTATGETLNINADMAAAALAAGCGARKILFLTDVPGLLKDPSDSSSLISQITATAIKEAITKGEYQGGMLPKVTACIESLDAGVADAHFLDGRLPHALLLELLTDKGIGTMILSSEKEPQND